MQRDGKATGKAPEYRNGQRGDDGKGGKVAHVDVLRRREAVVAEEQQGAEQQAVKDPRKIVHGCVADALDVPVVEAVRLEDHDPEWQRRKAPEKLVRMMPLYEQRARKPDEDP